MRRTFFSTIFTFLIDIYRWGISPFLPSSCRHIPSCSNYMRESIIAHGPFKGIWLGLKRIMKCHPWGSHGYDPVPDEQVRSKKYDVCREQKH